MSDKSYDPSNPYMTPQMRLVLEGEAMGHDILRNRAVSPEEQKKAMNALHALDRTIAADKVAAIEREERARAVLAQEEHQRQQLDQQRKQLEMTAALERERMALDAQRLLQEGELAAQRLQIEQAQVVVQLLDTVAKAGVSPDKLLETFHVLTERLLPGPSGLKQIAARSSKE